MSGGSDSAPMHGQSRLASPRAALHRLRVVCEHQEQWPLGLTIGSSAMSHRSRMPSLQPPLPRTAAYAASIASSVSGKSPVQVPPRETQAASQLSPTPLTIQLGGSDGGSGGSGGSSGMSGGSDSAPMHGQSRLASPRAALHRLRVVCEHQEQWPLGLTIGSSAMSHRSRMPSLQPPLPRTAAYAASIASSVSGKSPVQVPPRETQAASQLSPTPLTIQLGGSDGGAGGGSGGSGGGSGPT